MNNKIKISVVISTWNRVEILLKILENFKNQTIDKQIFEIIICDSFSKDGTDKAINKFKLENIDINILYTNIKKNILASKRNHGINLSNGEIVVLIDDDCLPNNFFLETYLKEFKNLDEKIILNGVVDYPESYMKKSNYLKYRKSRHFQNDKYDNNRDFKLEANKIVAMNMAFKKSKAISETKYFNEEFLGYGFEDYDFGWRLIKAGFQLKKSSAKIIHMELGSNFLGYLKKFYHLGRDGMNNLIKINYDAAQNSVYFKIESNKFAIFFIKSLIFLKFFKFIEKIIANLEKMPYFYTPLFYRLALTSTYIRGCADREKALDNLKKINKGWYN